MKYYLIAGERSGDLHASRLLMELKKLDPEARFRFWGGDECLQVGGEQVHHYKEFSAMGFWEVFMQFNKFRKLIDECKTDIQNFSPDAVILVDFSGFNLRIARFAYSKGFKVFYYIAPKVWAWYQSRAKKIKKSVHRLYSILPFEIPFFKEYDIPVKYVGNPLVKLVDDYPGNHKTDDRSLIAILPGSRSQEVVNILSALLEIIPGFPNEKFIVAGVNNLPRSLYDSVNQYNNVELRFGETYSILSEAKAAVVTSGTATLETALFNVPQVVCYRTSPVSYWIGKRLVKVDFISLVNLIAGREVVKELIQNDLNYQNLQKELTDLLENNQRKQSIRSGYDEVRKKLGQKNAAAETALDIHKHLSDPQLLNS
jgi:lipid-A-disaccharide synthase